MILELGVPFDRTLAKTLVALFPLALVPNTFITTDISHFDEDI